MQRTNIGGNIVKGHGYIGGGYTYYQEATIIGNQTVDGTVGNDGLLIVSFGKTETTGYSLYVNINGQPTFFSYQGPGVYPNGVASLPVKAGDTYSVYTNNDTGGHWFIHVGLALYR